jgi:hypothetical protein
MMPAEALVRALISVNSVAPFAARLKFALRTKCRPEQYSKGGKAYGGN